MSRNERGKGQRADDMGRSEREESRSVRNPRYPGRLEHKGSGRTSEKLASRASGGDAGS